MGKVLSAGQVAAFERDGYVFPVDAMSAADARALGRRIEDYERESGVDATKRLRVKGHLVFPWLVELARHPAILDAVEDLLGPDILVYLSTRPMCLGTRTPPITGSTRTRRRRSGSPSAIPRPRAAASG